MSRLCVDSGFLIALYARKDQPDRRTRAREYLKRFDNRLNQMVLAWPVMYEVLRSPLTGDRHCITQLENHFTQLKRNEQLVLVDDSLYRERAFEEVLQELQRGEHYRGLSLVDRVIRTILGDPRAHVDALITFDPGDFVDVCRQRRIELFS